MLLAPEKLSAAGVNTPESSSFCATGWPAKTPVVAIVNPASAAGVAAMSAQRRPMCGSPPGDGRFLPCRERRPAQPLGALPCRDHRDMEDSTQAVTLTAG